MWFKKQYPIGIDISDYSIEVLQLNKKREVLAYGRTVLEEGIVEDGRILEKEKLARKLSEVLSNTKPRALKTDSRVLDAFMSLPESRVFIHYFDSLPSSSRAEKEAPDKKQIVEAEARKVIPYEIEKLYWDWREIPKSPEEAKGEEARKQSAFLFVGAPKDLVDQYIEVARMANLALRALDIESESLARALAPKVLVDSWLKTLSHDFEAGQSSMLADIGARTAILSIFDGEGRLRLSVNVPIGGQRFNAAIVQKLGVSKEEAETLKRELGFDAAKPDNKVFSILQAEVQPLIQEMKNALQYYESKSGKSVGEVILAGGSSLLPKIDEYIALNVGKKSYVGNPLEKIKNGQIFTPELPPIFFSDVIGLALRASGEHPLEGGVNLLPKDYGVSHPSQIQKGKVSRTQEKKEVLAGPLNILKKSSREMRIMLGVLGGIMIAGAGFFIVRTIIIPRRAIIVPAPQEVEAPSSIEPQELQEAMPEAFEEEGGEEELSTAPEVAESEGGIIEQEVEELPPEIQEVPQVTIGDTPTGWLRVRKGAGTTFAEIAKVNPGEKYEILEESEGWIKIKLKDGSEGWISSQYAKK